MSTTDWKDVTLVLANGEKRPVKACYVGDGWCDVIAESDGLTARMWVLADGSASPPMNPCRLAEPFPLTPLPDRALPVTPAERFCAAVLRAWTEWPGRAAEKDPDSCVALAATAIHEALWQVRLISPCETAPAGRDLLARVEAEERTPATVLFAMARAYGDAEAAARVLDYGRASRRAAYFHTCRDELVRELARVERGAEPLFFEDVGADYAARLAGTTPIDAPPRKEPER